MFPLTEFFFGPSFSTSEFSIVPLGSATKQIRKMIKTNHCDVVPDADDLTANETVS